ncbi:lysostaphin resistance A-like protein [Corynebacterium pilbarense]
MLHAGEYAFASRNQPNYAWWRPLAEIVAVAVLTVAFVAVIGVSLEAAGVDTSSGAADKYFGYGSVVVEILAVLLAVRFIGRRPVASVFTGRPGTKPWVPFAAYALAFVVIAAVMGVVGVVGYGASWDQVIGDIRSDFPLELVVIVLAALAEEMAFRGVFFQAFTAWTKHPAVGAVLAAIPFVAMHPQAYGSPVAFAHYFLDALLYALLVWAFNSIWVAVAVHAAWNTFGSVQALGISNSAASLVAAFAAAAVASAVVIAVLPRAASSHARTPAQRGAVR